jgi:DNA-binding response OmpR family regulator
MIPARILIIEDNPGLLNIFSEILSKAGFVVSVQDNPWDGFTAANAEKPDLVILDVAFENCSMNGYDVCKLIKSSPETRQICVLMVSKRTTTFEIQHGLDVGADEYLKKDGQHIDVIVATVKALLRRGRAGPFTGRKGTTLCISCGDKLPVGIRAMGDSFVSTRDVNPVSLLREEYDQLAREALINATKFRRDAKILGKRLYASIFGPSERLRSTYYSLVEQVARPEDLRLRFECDKRDMSVPFEFMFGGNDAKEDYLALQHPLALSVMGVHSRRQPICQKFLNELASSGNPLKVLLVAANTTPDIPGVEVEVKELSTQIAGFFGERIRLEVTTLDAGRSTYRALESALQGHFDILHFAGHGRFRPRSPEESGIALWENGRGGDVRWVRANELRFWAKRSGLRLVYLSCCSSGAAGAPETLLQDDFLGVGDSLIQADVPSVVGPRSPIDDETATRLALEFYRALGTTGEVDQALYDARVVLAANRDNPGWLSPVLIHQA